MVGVGPEEALHELTVEAGECITEVVKDGSTQSFLYRNKVLFYFVVRMLSLQKSYFLLIN